MKKIILLFIVLFNSYQLFAQDDYKRGMGIIGNWGTMEGITELHPDYLAYLKRTNTQWVVIGNALHIKNSVDSTVELFYSNDYKNFVPSWPDATLRTMIQQLHSNGFKVVLAQGIDEPWPEDGTPNPALPAGSKPAWRYQIGQPKAPTGYTAADWPWDTTNTNNKNFVKSFWNSYTQVSLYHAKLCQELGVELFEVGAESQELFRSANIGTKYKVNYKTQIQTLMDSVRKYYTGKIAYYMHVGTWQGAVTTTKADTQWHNLWSDANFDVIGVSLYDAVRPTTANYTTTTTVNTVNYFKTKFKDFLVKYVKPVLSRYPTKPIVALELGFQIRDITNIGLTEPKGLISADDYNKNGILDAEEIQSNLFEAYFNVSDSLGYPNGAMIFGDNSESDAINNLFNNYNGWGLRSRYAETKLIQRFKNLSFNSSTNRAPKLLKKTHLGMVAYIGENFESEFFDASDEDVPFGDIIFYKTVWENYPWFGAATTKGKIVGIPQPDDFGNWNVKLFVHDVFRKPSVDTAKFKIWVVNKKSPRVVSTPVTKLSTGQAFSYQIEVKDQNGILYSPSVLKYQLTNNGWFLQSVSATGLVKGVPTFQGGAMTTAAQVKIITPTNDTLFDSWKMEVTEGNIAPLWENSRVLKIPGSTRTTFYISPGYDTTIHKDSLITFRVVPASDYNKSDTLVYTYNIFNTQLNSLVTSFIADKYNYADSVKYGARETKCVAIKNMSQVLQTNVLYECRVTVSDGITTANIPTPYPRFKLSSSSNNPAITLTASQLLFGKIAIGSTSATQNFKVSGSNLTSNITITPPTGFEIRTGTNNFSANAISLSVSNGAVNETTVDVRFAPTTVQHYSGSIKISSTNATEKNITVDGDGTATAVPFIVLSDSLIIFGNTTVGKYSDTLSFTITGGNISDTLKLASSEYFEIKISSSTTFSKLIKIVPTNGLISETKIDIRFKPKEANNYSDSIFITSTNLQSKILLKGTGVAQVNNAPVIKSIAEQFTQVNILYTYQVEAIDADISNGDTLAYSLDVAPTWLSISKSGLISGTPSNKNIGDTLFVVKVSDLQGLFATQKNNIKVTGNLDTLLKIYSLSPPFGAVGSVVTFKGSNFAPTLNNNSVWFGGIKAVLQSVSNSELKAVVPQGATYSYPVVFADSFQTTSPKPFSVTFKGSDSPYPSSLFGTSAASILTGNNPTRSVLANFNDDGKQELVVVNYGSSNISIYNNSINFKDSIKNSSLSKFELAVGSNPNGVAIGDINGDGKMDIIVSNFWSYSISVFKNIHTSGSLTASSFAAKQDIVVSSNGKPGDVALSDVDGDGKLDLITTDYNSVNEFGVSIFKNTSTQEIISFAPQKNFPTGKNPKRIVVRDANEDGKPDLFVVSENSTPSSYINYLQNKSVTDTILFEPKVEIPTGKNPRDIAFADFNNDGLEDFVVPNYEEDSVTVYQNTTTTSLVQFKKAAKFKVPYLFSTTNLLVGPHSVATSDVNGDGWIDFVFGSWGYQSAPLYINTKTSGAITNSSFKFFSENGNITYQNNPSSVLLGDLNGDSRPELIVTAYASDKVAIFRNKFGNYFSLTPKTITNFGSLKVGDKKFALFTMENGGDDTLVFKARKSLDSNFFINNYTVVKIAPDNFYTDSVWFAPKMVGIFKGKIVIETAYFSDTIYVEGIGTGKAILSLSTNNLDFGKVKINDSKKLSVKLKNSGNDTLFIKNFSLFGSTEFSFQQPPATGTSMAPSKEYDLEVTALPLNLGLRSAMLKINHNVGMDSVKFIMIGIGNPKIKLSVSKIDFGSVKQHLTKDSTLTIQNIGNDTLHIAKMELTNSQFTFGTTSTIRSIAPNNKSDEKISFKPLQNLGSVIAKLFIMSNNLNVVTKDSVELVANVVTKVPIGVEIPTVFSLSQNFPNPFNPATIIKFGLPNESYVKLEIYNSLGQLVNALIDEKLSARFYEIKWEASNLPTGMYFYKIIAVDLSDQNNKLIQTRKMILMK